MLREGGGPGTDHSGCHDGQGHSRGNQQRRESLGSHRGVDAMKELVSS